MLRQNNDVGSSLNKILIQGMVSDIPLQFQLVNVRLSIEEVWQTRGGIVVFEEIECGVMN